MPSPKLHDIRVIRYAQDGGYAAREWLNAFASIEFPPIIADGESFRIGVQITKKRAIDVVLRIEHLDTFADRLRARVGRSASDSLFRHPKACRKNIPDARKPLAVLSARRLGKPIRILVCEPCA